MRDLIQSSDIKGSFFFSLEQFGNIIVADSLGHQIKIFSNPGYIIHAISNEMLTEDLKLANPMGVYVDRQNNIVVAHENRKCNPIAF